jgi:mannose-6-phosphate isomerase-like protein (cupin superfamily)
MPEKFNILDKLTRFSDTWNPRIVAEMNGQHVKLARMHGPFVWHQHEFEDEFFMVIKGSFVMEFRDKNITLNEMDCIVVPRGVEHRPVAAEEVQILLFEPATTLNTGDNPGEKTKDDLEWV